MSSFCAEPPGGILFSLLTLRVMRILLHLRIAKNVKL